MVCFLTAIAIVPIAEVAIARVRTDESIAVAWRHLSSIPGEIRSSLAQAPDSGLWQRIVATNRIALTGLSGFERSAENESFIGRTLRPPAQIVMTRWLGAGNERVYPGREGWLFYRPDVEYLTRPGFLEPAQIERRIAGAPEWTNPPQPDPRTAIAQFEARSRGARHHAHRDADAGSSPVCTRKCWRDAYASLDAPLQNPSYGALVDDLRRDGVLVFDPSQTLAAEARSGAQYLATDTHWRPEAMEAVAASLADLLTARALLPQSADPGYQVERMEVRNIGDTARMLDLPERLDALPAGDRLAATHPAPGWIRRGGRRATRTCCCSATASATSTRSSRWDGARPRDSPSS